MRTTDMTVTQGNDQFYPTPAALAEKMLAGLDMDYVSSVLEPSAGKGDLVTAIARKNQLRDCPECGSDVVDLWYVGAGKHGGWRAICSSCLHLPDRLCETEQEAVDLWNGVIT